MNHGIQTGDRADPKHTLIAGRLTFKGLRSIRSYFLLTFIQIWGFSYSPKNPEKKDYDIFHKNIKQHNGFTVLILIIIMFFVFF